MTDNIRGKAVAITGASSGIGEATAKLLASKGAKVVLGARRTDNLKRITDEINRHGDRAAYQKLDVTQQSDNDAIVKLANDRFGRVDVMFLNAGLMPSSPQSALKTEEWHRMVDVNITGVLNGVAAVLPTFIAQKSGHIIATSSVAGLKAYPGGAVYGGTKWFVREFMEVLRMESAMEGTHIRTATIYPAAINTELLTKISDKTSLDQMQVSMTSTASRRIGSRAWSPSRSAGPTTPRSTSSPLAPRINPGERAWIDPASSAPCRPRWTGRSPARSL